jgi:hypothetical protein
MATDFRVRNLIADNTVYNTGNQTISGTKTFNSVISGNINTLFTGSAMNGDIVTWNSSSKRFQSSNIGYNIKYTDGFIKITEIGKGQYTYMGFQNTTEDYPLDYYFNIQVLPQTFFISSFICITLHGTKKYEHKKRVRLSSHPFGIVRVILSILNLFESFHYLFLVCCHKLCSRFNIIN